MASALGCISRQTATPHQALKYKVKDEVLQYQCRAFANCHGSDDVYKLILTAKTS